MNQSDKFRINEPKVVHEAIDGEVVIVNMDKGDYFSLVKAGTDIWEGLNRGISRGKIVEEMIQRYDNSSGEIENAVNDFIEQLEREELIILNKKLDESNNSNIPHVQTHATKSTEKLCFELPTLQKYTDMEELLVLDPIHEVDEMGWPNAKVEV